MDLSGIGQYDSSSSDEEVFLATPQRAGTDSQISKAHQQDTQIERGMKRASSQPKESAKRTRLSKATTLSHFEADSNERFIQRVENPENTSKTLPLQRPVVAINSSPRHADIMVPPPPVFSSTTIIQRNSAMDRPPLSKPRENTKVNSASMSETIFIPPQLLLKRPNISTEDEE